MTFATVDVVIIGAGPYGLSIAAHLRKTGRRFRIFGPAMRTWSHHMPQGMLLKSEGFASNLYDPDDSFTLKDFAAQNGLPYAHIGLPVPIETFVAYGLGFQRRFVPELEETSVKFLTPSAGGMEVHTANGDVVRAGRVVVAVGITHFAHLPPSLSGLPDAWVSHSSQHSDLGRFSGRRVAVVGAGASAVDIAALLHQVGADVHLVARRAAIDFHNPPAEPRPLLRRILKPRSGLGLGWRSRMCTDLPLLFRAMPEALRLRAVQKHLGPAPGWFVRDMVVDRVAMHLGATLKKVQVQGQRVHLAFDQPDRADQQLAVDHVVVGTGYKVALSRLAFIDAALQSRISKVQDTPLLSRHFESSVPGLYFAGLASANSFGPMFRFAYGARFAARRIAGHIARS